MVLFLSITLLIVFLYSLIILLLSSGIGKLKKDLELGQLIPIPVTLVIPFRDEKKHLPELVRDLLHQSYPTNKFEVIFVNDHSRDGSGSLLNTLISKTSYLLNPNF